MCPYCFLTLHGIIVRFTGSVWGCEYTPCFLNSGTSDKECSDPGGCEGIFDENDPTLDGDKNIRSGLGNPLP